MFDRHLRRHRRPHVAQDPAGDLQPSTRRPAAARDERGWLLPSAAVRRRLPKDGPRVARRTFARQARGRPVARLRRGDLLRAGRIRRAHPRTATWPSGSSRSTPHAERAPTASSTWPLPRPRTRRSWATWARSASTSRATARAGRASSWRSRSGTTSIRRSTSTTPWSASSTSRRSTASTTTWARRPSAT